MTVACCSVRRRLCGLCELWSGRFCSGARPLWRARGGRAALSCVYAELPG